MGEVEVRAFLTHLAVDRKLAAATMAQGLAALPSFATHLLESGADLRGGLGVRSPADREPWEISSQARQHYARGKERLRAMLPETEVVQS
jgi:hypothetical protein